MIRLAILGVFWLILLQCAFTVKDLEPLKNFVPHEILGVEMDAPVAQVKKAYRRLSREKHPDKNPDNPEAVNEFIQITKAYTIMTDEKARENFLKYGNPDGKGNFAVGIALPNFLQKKEYQLQVLLAFFVIVVFVIPYYFLSKITANEKDVGGINVENRKIFSELINENMQGKHLPGIMAQSQEFARMKVRSKAELELLMKIKSDDRVKEAIPKNKEGHPPIQVKPICLLMGHMYDLLEEGALNDPGLKEDLESILKTVPSYIEVMLT
jgi:preprotein translocase subunit Sec63